MCPYRSQAPCLKSEPPWLSAIGTLIASPPTANVGVTMDPTKPRPSLDDAADLSLPPEDRMIRWCRELTTSVAPSACPGVRSSMVTYPRTQRNPTSTDNLTKRSVACKTAPYPRLPNHRAPVFLRQAGAGGCNKMCGRNHTGAGKTVDAEYHMRCYEAV